MLTVVKLRMPRCHVKYSLSEGLFIRATLAAAKSALSFNILDTVQLPPLQQHTRAIFAAATTAVQKALDLSARQEANHQHVRTLHSRASPHPVQGEEYLQAG